MPRLSASPLAFALVLGFASFACASPPSDDASGGDGAQAQVAAREIPRSTRDEHGVLHALWAIHGVESPDEARIRVYELSGDTAMNGTSVRVAIEDKLFELPANIRSVDAASSPSAGTVQIRGLVETLDAEGMPKAEPWEATLTYAIREGAVSPRAEVVIGGQTTELEALGGTAAAFLTTVTNVKVTSTGRLGVRVFEAGVGDPAMNGAQLLLALNEAEETSVFELGLDVRSVSSIAIDDATRTVRIAGTKDHLDENGGVVSSRFESRLVYSVNDAGVPTRVSFAR